MFILIKADHGILSGDNDVSTYEIHRDAWLAMCAQVDDERQRYGWGVEYQIERDHAYVDPCGGPEWHIFEV